MLGNYTENSNLLSEMIKDLSLGDKVSMETTFRKLTNSLKNNNEFRYNLVKELDPEFYIASLLNIPYYGCLKNQNNILDKNPRDYSKLVVNYQELQEIYLQNQ